MLRHQGIAARVRCGFATSLNPGFYEDHYVCEYYCEKEKRWILVDSQLDRPVSEFMRIDFNSLDVPRDRFLVAGKVWQEMRLGNINPTKCGIMNIRGRDFIRANVLIDLACLNKAENMMYTIPTGAIYQPCWLSYLGAVAGILKNQKHDFDIVQVGGYSGYVFLVTKNSRNPHSL